MTTDNVTSVRSVRFYLAVIVIACCSSFPACVDSSHEDAKHLSTSGEENKREVAEIARAAADNTAKGNLSKDIIGSWRTDIFDTEEGPMQLEYTFGKNGVLMTTMFDRNNSSTGNNQSTGILGDDDRSIDSVTYLNRYEIVGNQLIEVPYDHAENRKIHISDNKLTFEYETEKLQFVKKTKTESITLFITKSIADLKSPDGEIRWRAVQALRYAGPEARAGVPDLIATLKDRSSSVRQLALEALANIGPQEKEVVPALINVLKDKTDPLLSNTAASELGRFGSAAKDAVPILIDMLQSDNDTTSLKAAESLGNIGSAAKRAIPSLREYLKKNGNSDWVAEVVTKAIKMIESDVDSKDDSSN